MNVLHTLSDNTTMLAVLRFSKILTFRFHLSVQNEHILKAYFQLNEWNVGFTTVTFHPFLVKVT